MKTLCLTILSFLFVVAVRGQSPGNPTQINNTRYYSFKQFLGSDSAFLMPQRDTNWLPSRPAMIFRPADSTVYYWNLRYWIAFAKAVSPTNLGIYLLKANFIDSLNQNRQQLSKLGDTVYLSFGGKVNVMPDTTTKVATINFVKNQGYITTESDPVFKGSPAFGITTININNWNSAFNNATFDSVSKKLRLFAINGAQDSLVINSVLATNFNPVSHDSTIILKGTGKVYGDTLRVSVDTTHAIATHNWTLGQGFIKSETDPVATSKTITMVNGSGVTIFGTPTQTLGSNPTWTFKADTGLVATLAALGDSVVNKKHWDSAFVKVKFDTSSRVLTMYDFKNDSAFVVIPKGGTQNGMVAINTIRYGDILKIYADNGASTEITINNQDSLTRAHFGDTTTYFYPLKSNPAKYIPLTALSALVPLSYVNTTGVFSIDTSGAANGVATINYVNRQGYVKTETDPVATAKTVTVTQGTGITVTGASQTVGSNPAFTVAAQNTTAIWNANQLQGTPVSTTPPTTNQLLQYNGTNWIGFTPTYAPAFTVTTPLTYASNVLGEDTSSAAHGMASINYVQRQGYLTANQSITVTASGDATGSGSGTTAITLPLTLANSGVTAGGFTRGIVNAKGLITSATDTAYLPLTGGILTGALTGTAATFSTSITDGGLLSAPFVATNSSGTFTAAAYIPYNPASYPVNAGGETLQSVTTRNNTTNQIIESTGSVASFTAGTIGIRMYYDSTGRYTGYQNEAGGFIIPYNYNNITFPKLSLYGGGGNFNTATHLTISSSGVIFVDKNGVTQASIDSIGNIHTGGSNYSWYSPVRVIDIQDGAIYNTTTPTTAIANSLYYSTSVAWTHKLLGDGNYLELNASDGTLNYYFAPYGAAGATATINKVFWVDSLGKGSFIGSLNIPKLNLTSVNSQILFTSTVTPYALGTQVGDTSSNFNLYNYGTATIALSVNRLTNAITLNNSITSTKFITIGGLSTQFVKGDGSLDGTAYTPTNGTGATGTWGISITGTANPNPGSGNYIQNTNIQQPTSNFNISGTGDVGGVFTSHGGSFIQNAGTYVYQTWEQTNTSSWVFRVANADSIFRLIRNNSNGTQTDLYDWSYTGNYTNAGTITASGFYNSSDTTLKHIYFWNPSRDGIESIIYSWKKDPENKVHWGYAAQQVQKILPNAVITGTDNKLKVDYNEVHTYKIAELEKENKQLTDKVDSLESKLDNMQKEIEQIRKRISPHPEYVTK